jgi:hypothetical protein
MLHWTKLRSIEFTHCSFTAENIGMDVGKLVDLVVGGYGSSLFAS